MLAKLLPRSRLLLRSFSATLPQAMHDLAQSLASRVVEQVRAAPSGPVLPVLPVEELLRLREQVQAFEKNHQEVQRGSAYLKQFFRDRRKTPVEEVREELKSLTNAFLLYFCSLASDPSKRVPGIAMFIQNPGTWKAFLLNPRHHCLWALLRSVNQCISVLFWEENGVRSEVREGRLFLKLLVKLLCETDLVEHLAADFDSMIPLQEQKPDIEFQLREFCMLTFNVLNHLAQDCDLRTFIKTDEDCAKLVRMLTDLVNLYSDLRLHFPQTSDRGFMKLLKSSSMLEKTFAELLGERDSRLAEFSQAFKKVFFIDTEECKRAVQRMNNKDFVYFVYKFSSSELTSDLLSNHLVSRLLQQEFDQRRDQLTESSATSLFYSFGKLGIANHSMKELALKLVWQQIQARQHRSAMHSLVFVVTTCELSPAQLKDVALYLRNTAPELVRDPNARQLIKLANRTLMNLFARGFFDVEAFEAVLLVNLKLKNSADVSFGRMVSLVRSLDFPDRPRFEAVLTHQDRAGQVEAGCQAFLQNLNRLQAGRSYSYLQTTIADLLRKAGFRPLLEHRLQNHIVDIYVPELKLCIEVDGEGHYIPTRDSSGQTLNNMTQLRNHYLRSNPGFEDHEILIFRSSFDHDREDSFLEDIAEVIRRRTGSSQK